MAYSDNPHKNGRPASDSPTTTISIRLTHEELESIGLHAQRREVTRAALIRAALERSKLFDPDAELPRLNC